jgi:hypothetical protein
MLSSRQRLLRSRAARDIASRKKRWLSTQREFVATGEGYRNSEPSDIAKLADYILLANIGATNRASRWYRMET